MKMETHGNLAELKENLNQIFENKIKEIDKYFQDKSVEMASEFEEKHKAILQENEKKLKEELDATSERLENQMNLEARKALQKKKEEMIFSVIEEIKTDVKKIIKSKDYLDYLKKTLPKETMDVYADSDSYSSVTKNKITKDSSLDGLKAVHENVIYDLTISSLINSNLEKMKETIARELFK